MIKFSEFSTKEELIRHIQETTQYKTGREAEKYLRDCLPKESYYQRKCIEAIHKTAPGAFVWKAAAGPYGRGGIPDLCAVINGQFYCFEIKRPFIGALTKIQEQTIAKIRAAGGKAFVVSWPEQVEQILKERISKEAET